VVVRVTMEVDVVRILQDGRIHNNAKIVKKGVNAGVLIRILDIRKWLRLSYSSKGWR